MNSCSSCWLIFTIIIAFLMMTGEATRHDHIEYTTVPGYFLQDDLATDPGTFRYDLTNFGLIDRDYDADKDFDPHRKKTQWQRFEHQVSMLNHQSGNAVQYKVLYMGRHGEGYHNVAESYYGTPAWDCYWSKQDGNGTATWADAKLTEIGVSQAQIANHFWKEEIANQKIPVPEKYYTSPLDRCLSTANITFTGLELPHRKQFKPTIKELLRETIGIHTCDRRSSRTTIHKGYPSYAIEEGFSENDNLWKSDLRESSSAVQARLRELLDDVFSHDDSTYISFTTHSGAIGAILKVLGHRDFSLVTGAVIPVLVKAETVRGTPSPTSIAPSTPAPTCTVNPTTSPKV